MLVIFPMSLNLLVFQLHFRDFFVAILIIMSFSTYRLISFLDCQDLNGCKFYTLCLGLSVYDNFSHLGNNELTTLHPNTFQDLENLQYLYFYITTLNSNCPLKLFI